jgi:hypothetical protein
MKKGSILVFVGAFVASSVVYGQDYTFKVLANKGANEVKSGDGWQAVKTGASLKSGDELKVTENSYLGLVHASGKPMELKQAGNYKVADLAAKVGTGSSVLNKYTDFILSSNSAEAKKNRLSATGAVHRGLKDIDVFLPDPQFADIFNSKIIVSWESKSAKSAPYIVKFKNMFDEEVLVKETSETSLLVDLSDPKLANESAILVEVRSKSIPNLKIEDPKMIKRLTVAGSEKVKKAMAELGAQVQEETALNKYILAGFYEEHKLYVDAATAYQEAMKLAPDVAEYKEAYDYFIVKYNMKDK